jgi:MFS family permease
MSLNVDVSAERPEVLPPMAGEPIAEEPGAVRALRRRGLVFLGCAVAGAQVAMAIQMGLNANFLKEELHFTGYHLGLIEAARESCGIVAFGVLAALAGFAEPLVGAAMLLLLATGIGFYFFANNFMTVLLLSLVWSQGLHVWMPLPNSMALALAEPGRAGRRLGQIQAAGSAGYAGGLILALALTLSHLPFRPLYLVACAAAIAAATSCLAIPRRIKAPGPRLVFRRRYSLYYLLCLLEGWRKQISISFAGWLLVEIYRTPVSVILGLMLSVQVIAYVASPRVGRLIDRIGERKVLRFYYASLAFLFVGYALIRNPYVLYGVFIIDSSFFVFAMALTTYVNKIAPKNEHTLTLSMGVAMNHIAAVAMPLTGGLMWRYLGANGYKWPFLVGAVVAGLSIALAARVPAHSRAA